MEIKNILWPTDLSKRSAAALPMVRHLSQKLSAAVHLLYVVDDLRRFEHFYGQAAPDLLKGLQEAEYRSAEAMMTQVCHKDLEGCPLWHRHLRQGDPAARIIELALDLPAELIVMATHGVGRGEDKARFFGSVAEKVIKTSPIPVLTVPKG